MKLVTSHPHFHSLENSRHVRTFSTAISRWVWSLEKNRGRSRNFASGETAKRRNQNEHFYFFIFLFFHSQNRKTKNVLTKKMKNGKFLPSLSSLRLKFEFNFEIQPYLDARECLKTLTASYHLIFIPCQSRAIKCLCCDITSANS